MKTTFILPKILLGLALTGVLFASCEKDEEKEPADDIISEDNLEEIFEKIEGMRGEISCSETDSLSFVAYGSKACGGPMGYLMYSTDIDIEALLEKVTEYTEAQKEYNEHHGIVSDCSLAEEPSGVECIDEIPTFIYLSLIHI